MAVPPELRGADFLKQLTNLLSGFSQVIDVNRLGEALRNGRRAEVIRLLGDAWESISPGLRVLLRDGIESAARKGYRTGWRVVTRKPYTVPHAAILHAWNQAARRVTNMGAVGRNVIRHLVAATIMGGAGNEQLRTELLRSGLGLDRVRANQLVAYAGELLARVTEGEINNERARRMLLRRAGRLTRERAWTIARTETADAQGYGRQKAWNDSVDRRVIVESEWRKHWLIKDDERTTDTCRALAKETTSVRGKFSDGFTRPPRHPRCRCVCVLRRVSALQVQKAA